MQFDWLITNGENAGADNHKCTYIKLSRKFLKQRIGFVYVDRGCDRLTYFLMCQKRLSLLSNIAAKSSFTELIFPNANSTWSWPVGTVKCTDGFRAMDYLQCHPSSQCLDMEDINNEKRFDIFWIRLFC